MTGLRTQYGRSRPAASVGVLLLITLIAARLSLAQQPDAIRIGTDQEQLSSLVDPLAEFGRAVASLGDLDGDGNEDILVGAPRTSTAGFDRGEVYILYLDGDQQVERVRALGDQPLIGDSLSSRDLFGDALLNLGDLNGDGNIEVAVGAPGSDLRKGAVWLLSLSRTGDVTSRTVVDSVNVGALRLVDNGRFGLGLAMLGDLDEDGRSEIAVGAPFALRRSDGSVQRGTQGEVWVMSLQSTPSGVVVDTTALHRSVARFRDRLIPDRGLRFGQSLAQIADFDGDGNGDVAIGAPTDVADGTVVGSVLLAGIQESGALTEQRALIFGTTRAEQLGSSLAAYDDVDGNSISELLVGVPFRDSGMADRGEVYRLFLDPGGRVLTVDSLSDSPGLEIVESDHFGSSIGVMPDLNGDGLSEILVGAPSGRGDSPDNVWIVFGRRISTPSITQIEVHPQSIPQVNQQGSITAHITDVSGIRRAWIDIRRGGEALFLTIPMLAKPGPTYAVDVPGEFMGERGFEFVVWASNGVGQGAGVEGRHPESGFHSVQIALPDGLVLESKHGTTQSEYQLVSIPLDLDTRSARYNLTDDLGAADMGLWRFVRHGEDGYVDVAESDFEIEPGRAYWMLGGEFDRTIRVGSGVTIPTNAPFQITLAPGWNLVGSPFAFDLPASALGFRSGQAVDVRSFGQGGWSSGVEVIRPFTGYAVWNDRASTDILQVDPASRSIDSDASPETRVDAATHDRDALLAKLRPFAEDNGYPVARTASIGSIDGVYPNPTRGKISFLYHLSNTANIEVTVFDIRGRRVQTLVDQTAHRRGTFIGAWEPHPKGERVSSGTYLIRMLADGREVSTRLVTIVD
jgi:hypothetical protein